MPSDANPWFASSGTVIQIPIVFTGTQPRLSTAQLTFEGDFSKCDTATRTLQARTVVSLSVSNQQRGESVIISVDNAATLSLSLPHPASITLDLHDALGTRIARLADCMMEAGTHRIDINRDGLASGVYFYRLTVGGMVRTGKVVVVR